MLPRIRIIAKFLVTVILSIVIWRQFLDPDLTVKKLTRRIEREIPPGSTKRSVFESLESGHFGFSGYNVGPDPLVDLLPWETTERKRYVVAWTPVRQILSFGDYEIRIAFYFDEEELLSDYKLQERQFDDSP